MKKHYLALIALLISFASIAQTGPITGTPLSICVGDMTTLSCTPAGGTWSSSAPGTASVGTAGDVLGVSAGIATITYAMAGSFSTVDVTVNPVPVISCGSTGMCIVCSGDSLLVSTSITGGVWTSSTPSVATIGSSSGMVYGIAGGTTTITYTLPTGCYATATITVNPAPTLYCVTSSCSYCAGGSGCPIGLSGSQVGVIYTLYNGLTIMGGPTTGTGSALSWGLQTMAGTYTVTAFDPSTGCRNTTTCNATITITPIPIITTSAGTTGGAHVCVGSTIALSATPTGGTWSSSNISIATVGSTGVVTGVTAGVTTINYTAGGCTGTISVTVDPIPTISGTLSVCVASTTTLTGAPGGGTWTSVGTNATVGLSSGIVTGTNAGTEVITYTSPAGCMNTVVVTVNPLPAISGTSNICLSATSTFTGTPGGGTWTSSNPSIATVNPSSGTVTGVAVGSAVITYTLPTGCFKSMSVNIITAPAPILCMGGGSTICAVCVLGTITLSSATPGGVWSSSTPSVATIGSASGVVTGVTAGVTTITYSLGGGCFTTATVTVNPLPAITGPNTVCAGFSITLTGTPSGGTWTSTGLVASVGLTTGIVTGLVAGVETITYTLPTGCATTYNVTVNPLPCPSLGVQQFSKASVEIFPNPGHSEITISMMEGSFNSLTITNNIGQVVLQQPLTKGETSVNIRTLPAAIYYVTFRGDNGTVVKRFIKE